MVEHITPYNAHANPAALGEHIGTTTIKGLAGLNAVITDQASMIAYLDDFYLMMILTLLTIPFLFMIKKVQPTGGSPVVLE
jgi:DHA2 family multidrug resistance protein